ncbi:MAG TPA: nicotinamide riboside transporter PnuC [Steroidobacteraceae bacterium]|nr:nicotinamide riboside transporter PnuC [Steroidobacteraceae bacterium]
MIDWRHLLTSLVAGLEATTAPEAAAVVLGLTYSLLAIRRSRWCWVAGGASSAILIGLSWARHLPMQAGLNIYYVAVSVYGWWHWSREQAEQGSPQVSRWPLYKHLLACLGVVLASALTARWLSAETQAAWPFLDPLTTWGSLLATWLAARVKLENWLYWLVIDSLLAFLFGSQGLHFVALLSIVYLGFSTVGFLRWRKSYRALACAN